MKKRNKHGVRKIQRLLPQIFNTAQINKHLQVKKRNNFRWILVGTCILIIGCIIVPISVKYSPKNKTNNNDYEYNFSKQGGCGQPNVTKQINPPFVFDHDDKATESLSSNNVYGSEMINKYLFLYGKGVSDTGSIVMSDLAGNDLYAKMAELRKSAGINRQLRNVLKLDSFPNSGLGGNPITCSYIYHPVPSKGEQASTFLFVGTTTNGLYVINTDVLSKGSKNASTGFVHVGGNLETSQIDSITSYKQNIYFTIGGHLDWFNFNSIKGSSSTKDWSIWKWNDASLTHKVQLNNAAPFYLQPGNPVIAINPKDGIMAIGSEATADPSQSEGTRVVLGITRNSLTGSAHETFLNNDTITSADWIKYPCDSNFMKTGNLPAIPPLAKDLPGYGSINHLSFDNQGGLYIFNSSMGFSYVNNPAVKKYSNLHFYTYLPNVQVTGVKNLQNSIWSGCLITYHGKKWFIFGSSHGALIAFQPFNNKNYKNIKHDIFIRSQFYSDQNLNPQQVNSIIPLILGAGDDENSTQYIVTTVTGLGAAIISISDLIR